MNDKVSIAIDVSLNSTGIYVKNGDKSKYVSMVNINSLDIPKKSKVNFVDNPCGIVGDLMKLDNFQLLPYYRDPLSNKADLNDWHRNHIVSTNRMAHTFLDWISNEIANIVPFGSSNIGVDIVIENYSYGSANNNLIQIAEYTRTLKNYILSYVEIANIYIYTSPSVKKWMGKGSMTKYDIMEHYINKYGGGNDSVYTYIKNNKSHLISGKNNDVKTPISDILDAKMLAEYHHAINYNE